MPKFTAQWRRIVKAGPKPPVRQAQSVKNPDRLQKVVAYAAIGLAVATALPALASGYQTWVTNQATKEQLKILQDQQLLAERGLVTGRFTAATEQLASNRPAERIGGIYALREIARDDDGYRSPIIKLLSAYVRDTSVRERSSDPKAVAGADLQAAFSVLAVLRGKPYDPIVDLTGSYLPGLSLNARIQMSTNDLAANLLLRERPPLANIKDMVLVGADLRGAAIFDTFMKSAIFARADLTNSRIGNVDGTDASFNDAVMPGSIILKADLPGANLEGAVLDGAVIGFSSMIEAKFGTASLEGAVLYEVDLRGADLAFTELKRATLRHVRWNQTTRWPADMIKLVMANSRSQPDGDFLLWPVDIDTGDPQLPLPTH
ncbi:pentapeptide repeat-containing protein [Catellatospora bangladeshensis]|uniref:Pentapeptide repeat-containing protein n=1 Tax=Catellatospora bangladeshensis TaxID=310355 RepID=A0A8J3NLG4_9ACTN|nr:pentapeptide repeat-containing protein [Catellatospora bangladeshensis]GIF83861.1 hypothetical protein Cba03nite_52100 [Catellatospora bangladeshensis]